MRSIVVVGLFLSAMLIVMPMASAAEQSTSDVLKEKIIQLLDGGNQAKVMFVFIAAMVYYAIAIMFFLSK